MVVPIRRYEALVLLDVGLVEEDLEKIVAKLKEMIETSEGGELLTLDRWGKKRLAYEINKKQFGYYVLYEFMAKSTLPAEMDRFCRLDTGVMRHQILVIPENILNLKEKEEKIKAAMSARRAAAQDEKTDIVEDMLEPSEDANAVSIEENSVPVEVSSEDQETSTETA